jgi:phosphoglycolate phosphatase-like HAD superfamily hydrolase
MGDRLSDLEAGDAAGLAHGVHVLTGYGTDERERVRTYPFRMRLHEAESIADAPAILAMI